MPRSWSKLLCAGALGLTLVAASRLTAAGAPLLALEATIPLGHVTGRIDHMAGDVEGHRLFVAELGNGSVDAIDLVTGQTVGRIGGLKEPQGLALIPAADWLAVATAGDGKLSFFRVADPKSEGSIDLGSDADNLRLDSASDQLIAGFGTGGLAVIDSKARSQLADIVLPAHPEGFQLTRAGTTAFVNLPDAKAIAVVDLAGRRVSASWPTPWASSNFPMAIDQSQRTLAIAFRDPALLVLLDAHSGALLASIPSCGDADDLFFDDRRERIYISCGEGVVEAYRWADDQLIRIARLPSAPGARTSLFVPELDRLFIAARAGGLGDPARILVFRPAP